MMLDPEQFFVPDYSFEEEDLEHYGHAEETDQGTAKRKRTAAEDLQDAVDSKRRRLS